MDANNKDEFYTFAELDFILTAISEVLDLQRQDIRILQNKIQHWKEALNHQNDKAVFFMPQQTYAIFSLIQNYDVLESVSVSELDLILSAVKEWQTPESPEKVRIYSKLQVLRKFLEDGNNVMPVVICISPR